MAKSELEDKLVQCITATEHLINPNHAHNSENFRQTLQALATSRLADAAEEIAKSLVEIDRTLTRLCNDRGR